MPLFYTPDITGKTTCMLPEEESRHCLRVLRLTTGDELTLTDGKGSLYHGKISRTDHKQCEVVITAVEEDVGKRDFRIHIAIAPTKHMERLEWFAEKCTEIGIDEITPLLCEHSERKTIKTERLEKIVIAAMKQSCKAYLPMIHPLTSFSGFVRDNNTGIRCIAHCEPGEKKLLSDIHVQGQRVTILIGPEGDFSNAEIRMALNEGYSPVSLGESRLRTETAGIVACHTIHLLAGMPPQK